MLKKIAAVLVISLLAACGDKPAPPPPEAAPASATPAAVPMEAPTVAEPMPEAQGPAVNEPMPPVDEGANVQLRGRGQLQSLDNSVNITGEVRLFQAGDGAHLLRLQEINTPSALALDVIFTRVPEPKTAEDTQSSLAVGALKGATGNMNYLFPKTTDLSDVRAVALVDRSSKQVVAYVTLATPSAQ